MGKKLTPSRDDAPITDFSDSTIPPYILARSGRLADVLPHDHLAILAMTSLEAPWGPHKTKDDPLHPVRDTWLVWRQKLECLIVSGDIKPRWSDNAELLWGLLAGWGFGAERETLKGIDKYPLQPRYFLHQGDVAPHLSELGVDSASGLSLWAVGQSGAQKQLAGSLTTNSKEAETKPSKGAAKRPQNDVLKKACPQWLAKKLRLINLMDCIAKGAEICGGDLVPGVDYSASCLVAVLIELGIIPPEEDRKTMGAALREHFDEVDWKSRAPVNNAVVKTLARHFHEGERVLKGSDE
ncbi:MAG: hypothetical protein KF710_04800 [Rhodocyclaceae bacterium]|nr:hypothetical protein [Rhodocyclaceae bacterium]